MLLSPPRRHEGKQKRAQDEYNRNKIDKQYSSGARTQAVQRQTKLRLHKCRRRTHTTREGQNKENSHAMYRQKSSCKWDACRMASTKRKSRPVFNVLTNNVYNRTVTSQQCLPHGVPPTQGKKHATAALAPPAEDEIYSGASSGSLCTGQTCHRIYPLIPTRSD